MDCEEEWVLLKCGGKTYEWGRAYLEKALQLAPENPEFNTHYVVTTHRLDSFNKASQIGDTLSLHPLKQAVKLNPEDVYVKALLSLKLLDGCRARW